MLRNKKIAFILVFLVTSLLSCGDGKRLKEAASIGDTAKVIELLEKGIDKTNINKSLYHAAKGGHTNTAKALLNKGAYVNFKCYSTLNVLVTPLMVAAPYPKTVQLLLDSGANVNAQDEYGDTALVYAVTEDASRSFQILLKKTNLMNKSKDGDGTVGTLALLTAGYYGRDSMIKELLKNGVDVNGHPNSGMTALIHASTNGHATTVQLLLDEGADVNAKYTLSEYKNIEVTALHMARSKGHINIAQKLLEKDIDYTDNTSKVALGRAAQENTNELLGENGISDDTKVSRLTGELSRFVGSYPENMACSVSNVKIVRSSSLELNTLEISLIFERSDISSLYKAFKAIFESSKNGKDFLELPSFVQETPMGDIMAFLEYPASIHAYASGFVEDHFKQPIHQYKIVVLGSMNERVGSVSISSKNANKILTGEVGESDGKKIAQMFEFDNGLSSQE